MVEWQVDVKSQSELEIGERETCKMQISIITEEIALIEEDSKHSKDCQGEHQDTAGSRLGWNPRGEIAANERLDGGKEEVGGTEGMSFT